MNRPILSRMSLLRILVPGKFRYITRAYAAVLLTLATLLSATCGTFSGTTDLRPLAFASTAAGENGEVGEPFGIAVWNGVVYVSDGDFDRIWRLGPSGPEIFADGLDTPSGMSFDVSGNLVVADTGS